MAPEVSLPDGPLRVLLGQDGLLSFPLAEQHMATLDTAHDMMGKQLIQVGGRALSSLSLWPRGSLRRITTQ